MNLKQQLEQEESRRGTVYRDSRGFWTIGVGRLVDPSRPGGLSDDEIDFLLANDIRQKSAEVMAALPWAATLNEPRRAVLIGMAFQMGTDGLLAFRQALEAVRTGRWVAARAAFLDSLWARQTPERAARMARQMETGEWQIEQRRAAPPSSAPAPVPQTPSFVQGPTYTGPNRRAP